MPRHATPVPFQLLPPTVQAQILAQRHAMAQAQAQAQRNGQGGGMGGLGIGGPEAWALPGYAQRLPLVARQGQLGQALGSPELAPQGPDVGAAHLAAADPVGPANPWAGTPMNDLPLLEVLRLAAKELVWIQHPSPLDTKPLLGTREQYTTAAVIQPPTSSAAAAATAGGYALQAGYNESAGETVADVLTPATPSEFVTIFTIEVPPGRCFLVWSVAGEVHDWLGEANVIRWRVRVGDKLIVPETQLGQIGTPSNQLIVQEIATEKQVIYFEARNLDGESASLIGAYLLGWSWPLRGTGDTWDQLSAEGGRGIELVAPPDAGPQRLQLVQAAPGNARYGGASVWVDPRDGVAIAHQDNPGAWQAGQRLIWTGQNFVADQWSQPLPGFNPADLTFDA